MDLDTCVFTTLPLAVNSSGTRCSSNSCCCYRFVIAHVDPWITKTLLMAVAL